MLQELINPVNRNTFDSGNDKYTTDLRYLSFSKEKINELRQAVVMKTCECFQGVKYR